MCIAVEVFKFSSNPKFNGEDCFASGTVSFVLGIVGLFYKISKCLHKCNLQVVSPVLGKRKQIK